MYTLADRVWEKEVEKQKQNQREKEKDNEIAVRRQIAEGRPEII